MKINKSKYKGFGDWINNDKDFVIPMLVNFAVYGSLIMNSLLLWACIVYQNYVFAVIFGILVALGIHRVYKFGKYGGIAKVMPKVSANELIWNKLKLKKK